MSDSKTVLVTGSSTGFGRLCVQTLAKAGHTVIATMRNVASKNAEAAKQIDALGDKVHVVELDVTDEESVGKAISRGIELAGGIDVIVNNAGIMSVNVNEAFTTRNAETMMNVNYLGPLRVDRAVLPHMRKRGSGLLIHVTSTLGRMPLPFTGIYAASKYAVEALAETFRYELAPLGVDSVIVEPGAFPTNLVGNAFPPGDATRFEDYGPVKDIFAGFMGLFETMFGGDNPPDPQQVADAIVNLVDTPTGKRPLRTVVDHFGGEGPKAINAVSDEVMKQALTQFQMGAMLSPKG